MSTGSAFEFAAELFGMDDMGVEADALTYPSGGVDTFDVIRYPEEYRETKIAEGARQVRVLPLRVLASAFPDGQSANRALVDFDGRQYRIIAVRTDSTAETYMLELAEPFADGR